MIVDLLRRACRPADPLRAYRRSTAVGVALFVALVVASVLQMTLVVWTLCAAHGVIAVYQRAVSVAHWQDVEAYWKALEQELREMP